MSTEGGFSITLHGFDFARDRLKKELMSIHQRDPCDWDFAELGGIPSEDVEDGDRFLVEDPEAVEEIKPLLLEVGKGWVCSSDALMIVR